MDYIISDVPKRECVCPNCFTFKNIKRVEIGKAVSFVICKECLADLGQEIDRSLVE